MYILCSIVLRKGFLIQAAILALWFISQFLFQFFEVFISESDMYNCTLYNVRCAMFWNVRKKIRFFIFFPLPPTTKQIAFFFQNLFFLVFCFYDKVIFLRTIWIMCKEKIMNAEQKIFFVLIFMNFFLHTFQIMKKKFSTFFFQV